MESDSPFLPPLAFGATSMIWSRDGPTSPLRLATIRPGRTGHSLATPPARWSTSRWLQV